jgi:carboxymethylenebutenolidase
VDLFGNQSRIVCMFRMFSGMMLNSLEHNGIRSLKSALNYLEAQPFVDKDRVGAIGFCLGGNLSLCWACTDPRLKVIAPFYGMNPRPMEVVARACPVVGSYPGQDFTANAGRRLDETLDGYQVEHDIKIYPDAKHSFFNHGRNFDEPSAADAWTRTLGFFDQHLKAAE